MKIASMVKDRKILIKELSERIGVKPEYQGAPSFAYQIGAYRVMKDGSIEVPETEADRGLLRELHVKELIAGDWDGEREILSVKVPYDNHTGRSLVNIVHLVACRSELINKSIQCVGAFEIHDRFISALEEKKPETMEDFLHVLEDVDGNHINAGLKFESDGIIFYGFPATKEPDIARAYVDLSSLMNQMALAQSRIRYEKSEPINEKYAFRVWLLRLGMKGDKYRITRKVLLKNLEGHSAFRTVEQIEVAKEKYKAIREASCPKGEE